jgi:hypothetical protein
MRLAAPLTVFALVTSLLAGCGSSSVETGGSRARTVTGEAPVGPGQDGAGKAGAPVGARARSCETGAPGAEALRATGISCGQARQVLSGWQRERSCSTPSPASRRSCLTRSYRCLATRTDRGIAVSCARQGQSIAFIAKR